MEDFKGLVNAIVTPFGDDGSVLEAELRAIVDHQFGAGLHGLFVCGSGGEGLLMDVEERQHVAEVVMDQTAGRGKVIVHVERVVKAGTLHPMHVKIPGIYVDYVVVAKPENNLQTCESLYNPAYSGEVRVPLHGIPPIINKLNVT